MDGISYETLEKLGFKKRGQFPPDERRRIVEAVKRLNFQSFDDYSKNFEKALQKQLGNNYTTDRETCRVFKNIESKIKKKCLYKDREINKSGSSKHRVDLYNPALRIAIEVEKTKETTLLLDIIKFIVGNKRIQDGRPIIEYGVLIFPDKYRNKSHPDGQGSSFKNRICNELAFINQILFVKDILLIEYKTSHLL